MSHGRHALLASLESFSPSQQSMEDETCQVAKCLNYAVTKRPDEAVR